MCCRLKDESEDSSGMTYSGLQRGTRVGLFLPRTYKLMRRFNAVTISAIRQRYVRTLLCLVHAYSLLYIAHMTYATRLHTVYLGMRGPIKGVQFRGPGQTCHTLMSPLPAFR